MKISTLQPTNYDQVYRITDLEHFFLVVQDSSGNYVYNLNETVVFGFDDLPTYRVTCRSQWPLVSYKIYGTTRLAWLLMKVNDVKAKDAFQTVQAGAEVRYVPTDTVQSVLNDII